MILLGKGMSLFEKIHTGTGDDGYHVGNLLSNDSGKNFFKLFLQSFGNLNFSHNKKKT